jgi:hypothetical protein
MIEIIKPLGVCLLLAVVLLGTGLACGSSSGGGPTGGPVSGAVDTHC